MTHQQVKKMPVRQHLSLIPRYLPKIKIFVYTKTCTWTFVSALFVKTKQETGTLSLFWGWTDQQGNNPLCSTGKEQITVPACVSDACCWLERSQAQKAAYCCFIYVTFWKRQNYRERVFSGLRGHFNNSGVAQWNLGEHVGAVLCLSCGGYTTTTCVKIQTPQKVNFTLCKL